MICPSCAASEISPLTGRCDLCGFAPAVAVAVESVDAVAELARRQIAHEFEFKELIGRRDGTTVQRVVERGTGRVLVLKVIVRRSAEPDAEESFRATMSALAGFDHPNLTHVVRHGSTDSLYWFATEDHGSVSLDERLRKDGPIDLRATRRILTQVAGALDYLHRHGLVHGAVKTSNVLLDKDGWVRLTDLNFARPSTRRPARPANAPAFRPSWVAPEEIIRGERFPAADQYALAALAFECLTGATPGSSADAVAQFRADVPPRMVRAIERALDDDPQRRFPSCADFLWALEQDATVAPTVAVRPSNRATQEVVLIHDWEAAPDPKRSLMRAIQIGLGVVVVIALGLATPTIMSIVRPDAPPPAVAAPDARTSIQPGVPPAAITPSPVPSAAPVATPARAEPVVPRPRSTAATSSTRNATPPAPTRPAPASSAPASTAPAPVTGGAKLFINASPWGLVSIDGNAVGNTPRANVDLAPGSHTIRVSRAGYATWERTVRVAAGETLRITDIVLAPTQP